MSRSSAFELRGLVLDFALENRHVLPQGLLRSIGTSCLALEAGYAGSHLLVLNLPGISVSLVTVPLSLQKSHDTLQRIFGGLRHVGAIVLHHCARLHSPEAISCVRAHRGAPRVQLGELIESERQHAEAEGWGPPGGTDRQGGRDETII